MPSSHSKREEEEAIAPEEDDSNRDEANAKTSNFYDVYGPQVNLSLSLSVFVYLSVVQSICY